MQSGLNYGMQDLLCRSAGFFSNHAPRHGTKFSSDWGLNPCPCIGSADFIIGSSETIFNKRSKESQLRTLWKKRAGVGEGREC